MRPLVIVGAGGFGREVLDTVRAINDVSPTWDVLGFVDDAPSTPNVELVQLMGSTILGRASWLDDRDPVAVALAIGANDVRAALDARWRGRHSMPVLIHPRAYVGSLAALGDGTIIAAGAHLTTNVRTGRCVHVDALATVAHDCVLGDYSRVNPHGCVSGTVTLGAQALVGAAGTVLQNLTVGERSIVGANACVVRHVPEHTTVKGVPAR